MKTIFIALMLALISGCSSGGASAPPANAQDNLDNQTCDNPDAGANSRCGQSVTPDMY